MRKISRKINLIIVWNKEETKWGIWFILGNGKFTLKIKLNYHFQIWTKIKHFKLECYSTLGKIWIKKKIE